jgi:hypothetical protein
MARGQQPASKTGRFPRPVHRDNECDSLLSMETAMSFATFMVRALNREAHSHLILVHPHSFVGRPRGWFGDGESDHFV